VVDFGDEPPPIPEEPLSALEKSTARHAADRYTEDRPADIDPPEHDQGSDQPQPELQRRDRWDQVKQSRFIESIIMNVPIPPVFLGEDQYGAYVVLEPAGSVLQR